MRRFWLLAASVAAATPSLAQSLTPIVVELRLGDESLEAMAWRDGDGAIYVNRESLNALRLHADGDEEPVALSRVTGLTYREDRERAAVLMTCEARCFAAQDLGLRPRLAYNPDPAAGGFLNVDTVATVVNHKSDIAGAFELGLFNADGFGGITWTADSASGEITRLETNWNFDDVARRRRITIGDAFTRGGATGVPFRYGGIQVATDFSLDPGFVYFPTPTLRGEAAAPSTVDLYVDGVLRLRDRVEAGAFSITDAPVLSGGGVAQVVVTDALGRQQVYAQPFYMSPNMLRAGLSDYSFATGAERNRFTRASNEYGRAFASAVYRYGVSDALTAEGRLEASDDGLYGAGAGASLANVAFGQVDVGVATSQGQRHGFMARAGWTYTRPAFSFGLEAQTSTENFQRLGDGVGQSPPRLLGAASWSGELGVYGAASFAYTIRSERDANDVQTFGLTYTPPLRGERSLQLSALYFDQSGATPFLSLGLGFTASFGADITSGGGLAIDHGRASIQAGAQHSPDLAGGYGWRARGSTGQLNRFDGGVTHLGPAHEASLEASLTPSDQGLRGQYATALVWIDGEVSAARPVRESFALIDVGVPNATVLRDRRPAGLTNNRGRVILTGFRAYEPNRIGVDLDGLPWGVQVEADELVVTPRERSGAVARFAHSAAAGEARVLDRRGSPLAAGAVLVRAHDGARFPVGADGRVYLTGIDANFSLSGPDGCTLDFSAASFSEGSELQCVS